MNYIKITKNDIANGEGIGVVLWASGCTCRCFNCHNPQTWDFNAGGPFTEETMQELLTELEKLYISRLTLSGGHPLEALNLPTVYQIVKRVKEKFPNKTIWIYSGMTFEEIKEKDNFYEEREINSPSPLDVISLCDILVDGRYIDSQRDITLSFRGSSNQRIIDIQQTLKKGNIILWENQKN